MDCNFTQEVSLLVDGELPPHEAARLGAHVEGCAACRQARESFLILRQELRSYERAPDPRAQSRALASIFGSHAAGPRPTARRLPERLAEVFGALRLRPAHAATLALLLVAGALGLRWMSGSDNASRTRPSGAPALADANVPPARAEGGAKSPEKSDAVKGPTTQRELTQGPTGRPERVALQRRGENVRVKTGGHGAVRRRPEGPGRGAAPEAARAEEPTTAPPAPAAAFAAYAAGGTRAAADDPSQRIGRHAERVERLLRSFRNASLTAGDPTLDVADARRLSKRLLYNNIALRREAAGAGDLPVEGLLDSVEPVLLDISNLPDTPSPAAVGSIKERIHRRQLVGAMQARGMLASR